MRLSILVAAAVVLCSSAAAAQTAGPGLTWRKQPSAETLERYYPSSAADRDLNGYAVLRCRLGTDGGLQACRTVREEPEDEGFGAAALALAWEFEAAVPPGGGAPVGTTVDVPIRFSMAAEPAEPVALGPEEAKIFAQGVTFIALTFGLWIAFWIVGTLVLVVWPARRVLKAAGVHPGWAWLFLVPVLNVATPWILAAQLDPRRS